MSPKLTTGDDQFDAMVATMSEPVYGADDLYCGHHDAQGLAWVREFCPICKPKEPT